MTLLKNNAKIFFCIIIKKYETSNFLCMKSKFFLLTLSLTSCLGVNLAAMDREAIVENNSQNNQGNLPIAAPGTMQLNLDDRKFPITALGNVHTLQLSGKFLKEYNFSKFRNIKKIVLRDCYSEDPDIFFERLLPESLEELHIINSNFLQERNETSLSFQFSHLSNLKSFIWENSNWSRRGCLKVSSDFLPKSLEKLSLSGVHLDHRSNFDGLENLKEISLKDVTRTKEGKNQQGANNLKFELSVNSFNPQFFPKLEVLNLTNLLFKDGLSLEALDNLHTFSFEQSISLKSYPLSQITLAPGLRELSLSVPPDRKNPSSLSKFLNLLPQITKLSLKNFEVDLKIPLTLEELTLENWDPQYVEKEILGSPKIKNLKTLKLCGEIQGNLDLTMKLKKIPGCLKAIKLSSPNPGQNFEYKIGDITISGDNFAGVLAQGEGILKISEAPHTISEASSIKEMSIFNRFFCQKITSDDLDNLIAGNLSSNWLTPRNWLTSCKNLHGALSQDWVEISKSLDLTPRMEPSEENMFFDLPAYEESEIKSYLKPLMNDVAAVKQVLSRVPETEMDVRIRTLKETIRETECSIENSYRSQFNPQKSFLNQFEDFQKKLAQIKLDVVILLNAKHQPLTLQEQKILRSTFDRELSKEYINNLAALEKLIQKIDSREDIGFEDLKLLRDYLKKFFPETFAKGIKGIDVLIQSRDLSEFKSLEKIKIFFESVEKFSPVSLSKLKNLTTFTIGLSNPEKKLVDLQSVLVHGIPDLQIELDLPNSTEALPFHLLIKEAQSQNSHFLGDLKRSGRKDFKVHYPFIDYREESLEKNWTESIDRISLNLPFNDTKLQKALLPRNSQEAKTLQERLWNFMLEKARAAQTPYFIEFTKKGVTDLSTQEKLFLHLNWDQLRKIPDQEALPDVLTFDDVPDDEFEDLSAKYKKYVDIYSKRVIPQRQEKLTSLKQEYDRLRMEIPSLQINGKEEPIDKIIKDFMVGGIPIEFTDQQSQEKVKELVDLRQQMNFIDRQIETLKGLFNKRKTGFGPLLDNARQGIKGHDQKSNFDLRKAFRLYVYALEVCKDDVDSIVYQSLDFNVVVDCGVGGYNNYKDLFSNVFKKVLNDPNKRQLFLDLARKKHKDGLVKALIQKDDETTETKYNQFFQALSEKIQKEKKSWIQQHVRQDLERWNQDAVRANTTNAIGSFLGLSPESVPVHGGSFMAPSHKVFQSALESWTISNLILWTKEALRLQIPAKELTENNPMGLLTDAVQDLSRPHFVPGETYETRLPDDENLNSIYEMDVTDLGAALFLKKLGYVNFEVESPKPSKLEQDDLKRSDTQKKKGPFIITRNCKRGADSQIQEKLESTEKFIKKIKNNNA